MILKGKGQKKSVHLSYRFIFSLIRFIKKKSPKFTSSLFPPPIVTSVPSNPPNAPIIQSLASPLSFPNTTVPSRRTDADDPNPAKKQKISSSDENDPSFEEEDDPEESSVKGKSKASSKLLRFET